MKRSRKGQEEIVGFVLIVVIIAVALVIFLGIKLRNPEPVQKESEILYQFIESAMEQTTDCVLRENGKNLAMGELIKECDSLGNSCLNGQTSCDVARSTMDDMLKAAWKVGPDYPTKGYELNATYNQNNSESEEIFSLMMGNCTNSYIGNSYFLPQFPGNIVIEVKLCS